MTVEILQKWVEDGVAPEFLNGISHKNSRGSRPICMWPRDIEKCNGNCSDPVVHQNASNWECVPRESVYQTRTRTNQKRIDIQNVARKSRLSYPITVDVEYEEYMN